jgi:hypothetical protein
MDTNTPIKPASKKGKVRAEIAQMLMDEVAKGKLTALIARSADFYGPGLQKSGMVRELVFEILAAGEKANWMCAFHYKHSVTYTPRCRKSHRAARQY